MEHRGGGRARSKFCQFASCRLVFFKKELVGQIPAVGHFHVAEDDLDKIHQGPDAASAEGDKHEPPVGIAHHEAVNAETSEEEANEDHGHFGLDFFLF